MLLFIRFDAFSIARVTVTISWKPRVSRREKNRRDQASNVSRADGLGLKCFTAFLMVIRAVYGSMYARLSGVHGFSMYYFQVRARLRYTLQARRDARPMTYPIRPAPPHHDSLEQKRDPVVALNKIGLAGPGNQEMRARFFFSPPDTVVLGA